MTRHPDDPGQYEIGGTYFYCGSCCVSKEMLYTFGPCHLVSSLGLG